MNTKRKKTGRKLLSFLLALALAVGLLPGMGMTAYAADVPYASLKNTTSVINFDGKEWYLIDYDESSVTLLSKECVGASVFNPNEPDDNTYSGSTVENFVNSWYTRNISPDAQAVVCGSGMFLLTEEQAVNLSTDVLKCSRASGAYDNHWWLCSKGTTNSSAAMVNGESGKVSGYSGNVWIAYGVRPALKLDLSSVIFSSDTNTFSLKPSGYSVTITGGANATTSGGATSQTGLTDAMTTVTYMANTGYYFEDFTDITNSGITATRTSNTVVTISGTPTADATITVPDAVEKTAATVTKAPAAKTLTYTGSAQELVTAGTASGGEMQYVLGTDKSTTPTTGFTTSIPTATEAGTYYVWYKAVGDNDHVDSKAAVIEVTISEKAVTPEIAFDVTTMELGAGESGSIKATVVPEDAKVQWKSDKETVATVDNTGKVTAVGAGTAKITATITVAGTQYKAECTVTVQEEPVTPEVKFDVTTMDLKSGQTGTIAVTVEPSDAVVTWNSDKETVATVDNTGKVTAVGAGTAKITATITVAGTQYKAECTVTVAEEEPSETKPVISIDDLPDAIDGESYNYTLTAGGVQPITWSITAGSLPAGLSLESESGKISGTPTSTGTSTFTVTATNTYDSTSKEMSITVQAGSTVVDTEGSAPDDQKTAVESAPSVVRDIVGDAAGGVTESDTVRLILATDSRDEGSVTGEEKEAVDAIKGAAEGSGLVVGTFVDLTLSYEVKNANGEITSSGQISQTARPLTVKFPIPAGLQKAGRLFKIFRYHGSNASEIGSGSGDAVDVSTDLFSIYAIAYTDDAAPDVPEGEESSEQPHVHTFAWDTRNATADTDGEMRYQCTKCGMIQTRVPISAYYIFNKETTEKIRAAKQGETVKIETRRWISFHKMVAEALAERKDVTVEVSFLDQGHKGNPYTFTIPAGTDLTPLFDESGFAGFMYLGNKFGLTAVDN